MCVGQAKEEMGVGRLASGRAVDRTEDTGHNYGSGGKNVKVVIIIEIFPSTDFLKCIISKNVQNLRSYT